MKYLQLIILLIFFAVTACSRVPVDYKVEGKIYSDQYTPAVTEVSLAIGDISSVSLNKLQHPDFKTNTKSDGSFLFHLTKEEVYLNGTERVLGIQSSEGEKYIQILIRTNGVITDIGKMIFWNALSKINYSEKQINITWTPLYASSGVGADTTTFFLYCGDPLQKCWETEIKDTGKLALSSYIPITNPVCTRLKGTREENNEIVTYMSDSTYETLPKTYTSLLTECTFSINGENTTLLNDKDLSTRLTKNNIHKIDISCPHTITINKIFLYNFHWEKDGSPWNGDVTINIINNETIAGTWKIKGQYNELDFETPQIIKDFTIDIMENDIFISSAAEVRGFE